MDLQAIYESISSFWNQISPILIAHLIFLIAWLWLRKSDMNLLEPLEKVLRSESYKRWKTIFDEFNLRPAIPLLSILIVLIYFVILGDVLEFLAGGLFSPLSVIYTETDFWRETNNESIIGHIADIATYQGNADSSMSKIHDFKTRMLEEYKGKYPTRYHSLIEWRTERQGKWNRYYQLSLAGFIVLSAFLLPAINRKVSGLSYRRLLVVLGISLVLVIFSRYQAEQTVEQTLGAELSFVAHLMEQDSSLNDVRLTSEQREAIMCGIYYEKASEEQELQQDGDTRRFWISRYLEPLFKREFFTIPDNVTVPSECNLSS